MGLKDYSVKKIELFNESKGVKKRFLIEFFNESRKLAEIKSYLLRNIDSIIEENWGKFTKDFIIKHILRANRLQIVRENDKIVGLAAVSKLMVKGKHLLYLEFTVVNEDYQGYHLSTVLNAEIIVNEFFKSFIARGFKRLNVVTLTRNVRVLAALKKFSSYIYPDPQEFKMEGKLSPATDETWMFSKEILKKSWKPDRQLLREGNVLVGSYELMPWLILPKMQRHYDRALLEMGEKYLGYSEREDKEFIVHTKFSLYSILRYLFWSRYLVKKK